MIVEKIVCKICQKFYYKYELYIYYYKAGNCLKQIDKLFAKSSQYNLELKADLSLTNNSYLFFNGGLEKSFMQHPTT